MLKMLMPFGKHRGKNLNTVFKTDKRYIEWLVTTDWYNTRFSNYAKKSKELLNDYDKNIVLSDNINIYTDGSCAFNGMKGATKSLTNTTDVAKGVALELVDRSLETMEEGKPSDKTSGKLSDKSKGSELINLKNT